MNESNKLVSDLHIAPLHELENTRARLAEILKLCLTSDTAHRHLEEAENLANRYRNDTKVQAFWLQIRERTGDSAGLSEQWAALLLNCPQDPALLRLYVRYLMKAQRKGEIPALIDQHLPENMEDMHTALARAGIMVDAHLYDRSDTLFRKLIDRYDHPTIRVRFAKNLHKRGLLYEAIEVLAPVAEGQDPDSPIGDFNIRLMDDYDFFCRLEPSGSIVGQHISMLSLKHALLHFRYREIVAGKAQSSRIALITGSLGPGGAERQLARLACCLTSPRQLHRRGRIPASTSTSHQCHRQALYRNGC